MSAAPGSAIESYISQAAAINALTKGTIELIDDKSVSSFSNEEAGLPKHRLLFWLKQVLEGSDEKGGSSSIAPLNFRRSNLKATKFYTTSSRFPTFKTN